MTIKQTTTVTTAVDFTEQDKATLRGMYRLVTNFGCGNTSIKCHSCPFASFCAQATYCLSNDPYSQEEEFINEIRKKIIDSCEEE